MQIVIDIPEDVYKKAKETHDVMCDKVWLGIKYGTPLDDVKAEIMQLDYELESFYYASNDMLQAEMVHTICREEVLQILDNIGKAEKPETCKGCLEPCIMYEPDMRGCKKKVTERGE